MLKPGATTNDERYRKTLYHLMASQTSGYRYWAKGSGSTSAARVVDG